MPFWKTTASSACNERNEPCNNAKAYVAIVLWRTEKRRMLSTPFHKYDHVCGEGFSAQTRRERRAYPFPTRRDKARATTSGRKEPPPAGLRRFSVLALLLLGHPDRSGRGMLPSSRLARTEKRRNKRGRIYETEYLACLPGREGPEVTGPSDFDFDPLTQKFRTRVQDVHIEHGFDPRGEFANT